MNSDMKVLKIDPRIDWTKFDTIYAEFNEHPSRADENVQVERERRRGGELIRLVFIMCTYLSPLNFALDGRRPINFGRPIQDERPTRIIIAGYNFCGRLGETYLYHRQTSGSLSLESYTSHNRNARIPCTRRAYLFFYFGSYMSLKLLVAGLAHHLYDLDIEMWTPTSKYNHTTQDFGAMCSLPEDIVDTQPQLTERIHNFARWFNLLGTKDLILTGHSAFLFMAISFAALVMWYNYTVELVPRHCCFDPLTLFFFPLYERDRMHKHLEFIVETIVHNNNNSNADKMIRFVRSLKHRQTIDPWLHRYRQHQLVDDTSRCHIHEGDNDQDMLMRFIVKNDLAKQVQPELLSSKTFKNFRLMTKIQVIFIIGLFLNLCLAECGGLIAYSVYTRATTRLQLLSCQQWHPQAVLVKDRLQLEPLKSPQDLETYKLVADQAITFHMMWSVFMVEWRILSRSLSFSLMSIELVLVWMMATVWMGLYFYMYLSCLYLSTIWQDQLIKQARACNDLIENFQSSETSKPMLNCKREQVYKCLVITYLNFELYRREHQSFQYSCNFIARQIVLINLSLGVLLYWNFTTVTLKSYTLLYVSLVFVLANTNLFVFSSASIRKKMEVFATQLSVMQARACEKSLSLSHIVCLWRRQVLCDQQTLDLYSVRVFGVVFGSDAMMSLNSYALGALLILRR